MTVHVALNVETRRETMVVELHALPRANDFFVLPDGRIARAGVVVISAAHVGVSASLAGHAVLLPWDAAPAREMAEATA